MPPSMLSRRHLIRAVPSLAGLATLRSGLPALAATETPPAPDKDSATKNTERSACLIFEMSITQETMTTLQNYFIDLHKQNYQNITLMINSSGGAVSPVLAAYHFITSLQVNLTTYAMADVNSAAIILFLAGKTRIANEQTRFRFHTVKNEYQGSFGADELTAFATDVEEINTRIKDIYKSKMNLADDEYTKLLAPSLRTVKAQEALRMNLVTKIEEPSIAASSIFTVPVPTAKNQF